MLDKWKDFPHHHKKAEVIANYILRARSFFLKENLGDACYFLGISLHYIQDYYSSLSARSKKHRNKTATKTAVSLYLSKRLVETARNQSLNLSRITEQALSSILDYLEPKTPKYL
jgi:hypothetical protein